MRVEPENVLKRKADSRGRIRVGTEYAGMMVEVAVLDAHNTGDKREFTEFLKLMDEVGADDDSEGLILEDNANEQYVTVSEERHHFVVEGHKTDEEEKITRENMEYLVGTRFELNRRDNYAPPESETLEAE
jgi:hypothetical protein